MRSNRFWGAGLTLAAALPVLGAELPALAQTTATGEAPQATAAPAPGNEPEPPPAPLQGGPASQPAPSVAAAAGNRASPGQQAPLPNPIPPEGELGLFALDDKIQQLVTAAAKMAQLVREAPSIASTVSREQLQLYGWISVNDLLYRQPGFSPSQDFERRTVSARGFYEGWNNNHILLMFDGLPYNTTIIGTAYTGDTLPLFLFKSVEVLRGPGSALYGSNAVNGVISLSSMGAADLPAPAIGLVRIGNQNTQTYDVMTGKEWKNFSFLAAYNYNTTDGYPYLDYDGSGRRDETGALRQFTTHDARSSHFGFLKLAGKGVIEGLSLQLHVLHSRGETGHGWLWYTPDDDSEAIVQDRQFVTLRYQPKPWRGKLTPDIAVRYEHERFNWHTRLYPSGTVIPADPAPYSYPDGLNENVETSFHSVFLRAQLSWQIRPGMTLIGGIEDTVFFYRGDDLHESNADINFGGTAQPFVPPGLRPLRPFLEPLGNHPLNNSGIYVQYASGRILRRYVSLTLGLRLDIQSVQFDDITQPGSPTQQRTNFAASPRLALLLFPHPTVTLKLLGNRAFRAPAPLELFGSNGYLAGSNPQKLLPETISTAEVGIDTSAVPHLVLRANAYYQFLENFISTAPTSSVILNLYTRGVVGVEAETLTRVDLARHGELQGFANYSFARTVQEEVPLDSGLSTNPDRLTGVPAHLFNFGFGYRGHGLAVSTQLHYQGEVARRDSDSLSPDSRALRPGVVGSWATVDARVSYNPTAWLQLGLQANNLLNQQGYLTKINDFPFDYRIDGVRVLGTLQITAGPF